MTPSENEAPPAPAASPPPTAQPPPPASSPPGYAPPPGYNPPPPGYYPPPAPYGYPPPGYYPAPPVVNKHDGVYLRMHFGLGYTHVRGTDGSGNELVLKGGGASLGVAIGGSIVDNFAIFGDLFFTSAGNADVEENGVAVGNVNGSADLVGFGVGVVYYIESVNVYLSGTVAGVRFNLADVDNNNVYESKAGLGFHGIVGKEWWVSENWGLGVAGEFVGASMTDKTNANLNWTGTSFNVLFSSTYN